MNYRSLTIVTVFLCLGCGDRENLPPAKPAVEKNQLVAVKGRVTDRNQPISGATVRLQATTYAAQSNADGHFELLVPLDQVDRAVTVSKPGYIIESFVAERPPKTLALQSIPQDSSDYHWVDPRPDEFETHNCANCHAEIFHQWSTGAHRRAASGQQFLELYAGRESNDTSTHRSARQSDATNQDELQPVERPHPHDWTLLEEYPEGAGVCASCHAPSAPLELLAVGDIRETQGVARLGVHCDFCHKVGDVDLATIGLTHGRFAMQLNRPTTAQFFFGPLDDVDRGEDSHLPLQSTSQFCAPCHEGTVFGTPVYTTYSEWLESPARKAGKQCQSCHMAPDGKLTNIAPNHGGLERDPMTLPSHNLLPGGRLAMLQRAVELKVSPKPNAIRADDTVNAFTITLMAKHVGHRVPTGFIDRHLILVVEAFDEAGELQNVTTGPTLGPAAGNFAGQPGTLFAKQWVAEDQEHPLPFWRAGGDIVDSRLLPNQPQTFEFQFSKTVARLQARVLYRKFWHQVEHAKGWPDSTLVVCTEHWNSPDKPTD